MTGKVQKDFYNFIDPVQTGKEYNCQVKPFLWNPRHYFAILCPIITVAMCPQRVVSLRRVYIFIYPLFDGDSRPFHVLLARLSSNTSHLRIHLPFQAQGQYDARLKRGRFHVVPFSSLQGPLQILDILTIFLKGCLLVHLSLPPSRVKMSLVQNIII